MIQIKNILFPTDFSKFSELGLKYALSLSSEYGAKLYILHVIQPPPEAYQQYLEATPIQVYEKQVESIVSKKLSVLVSQEDQEKVPTELLLRRGSPFMEIIRIAKEKSIDLIIIPTHGRTGLQHDLFGSTAEKVIRWAPCHVLCIKNPEHPFVSPFASWGKPPEERP